MKITMPLVLGVALAVVAGLFSATIFGLIDAKTDAQTSATASGLITGHVITTHKDAAGNILSYRQSDNLIVNQGENCVSKMLFGNHTIVTGTVGTTVCVGQNRDGFRYIGIGNNSAVIAVASNNVRLGNELNNTSYGNSVASGDTMLRQPATVVGASGWTNSTGSGSGTTASVVMSSVFKNKNGAGGSSILVSESGLFNNTDKAPTTGSFASIVGQDAMFARQTFSAITMNQGDTLTVQWTMSVGGSTLANLTP